MDREKLDNLYQQARNEDAQLKIAIEELKGQHILRLSKVVTDFIRNNGSIPFMVDAKLKSQEDHWGVTYDGLNYSFKCPFKLAYIINQIIGNGHPVRTFTKEDFSVPYWDARKVYQNICEAALVGEDLVFRVLDRKVV